MNKVLIVGSKGFIGSHCVDYFQTRCEVWSCDIVVDYEHSNYILLDPVNGNYDEVFEAQNFDLCINCSGAASVPDSYKNPQRDFVLNTVNVFRQLDAIRKHSPECKYVNMSSAAVYGNPDSLPIMECHELVPISPYGQHKKMAENLCKEFNELFSLRTCSLRVFSTFGPGLKKQLFWDLVQKRKVSSSVTLYGTGDESRDFIYITDLVRAIAKVAEKASFKGDAINVANGEEIKIREAVNTFYDTFPEKTNFRFIGEKREGDPDNWLADITKLKQLGYKKKVSLREGLENYTKWIEEHG